MGKKIIVAGAGHGGLTAAAQLARAGFDVTVYERHKKEDLGYDWFDALNPNVFQIVGCPHPEAVGIPWKWRADVTYFGPNTTEAHKIPQQFHNQNEIEIIMERRDIYKLLIGFAENNGVKMEYGVTIKAPLLAGDRIVGVSTDQGDFYADLVIDAAGMESVIRTQLPDCLHIQKHPLRNERIYTYRAFYDLPVDPKTVKDVYKVMFCPDPGDFSLSWIYTQDTYTDLLIGHMTPPSAQEVEEIAERYRQENPQLGKTRLRGGQTVPIPFRRPLSIMVADGYAAIGDAAFMTMPLNCSGISTSIEVSKILADAVIADTTGTYSAETLWQYQYEFFQKIGKGIAPISLVKDMITSLTHAQMDYAFDTGIITYRELTITADQHSIRQFLHFDPQLPKRGLTLAKDRDLLKKAAGAVADTAAFLAWAELLPRKYSRAAVQNWAKGYDKIFTRHLHSLFPAYFSDRPSV
ncbi:MAG: NAD(P)/FAD-dependent oxidoreductase [Clostridia bacterium]|nr:NAD(P)/FAD-dependent oxidoreductase [Clostridia bacterium]